MSDIKEVAKRANVSPSTVSRVIGGKIPVAEETKNRVLAAIAELNYRPNIIAQGLKGISTKTIGLVIPNVRSLVFPAAIRGIEDIAKKNGYVVVLCNTDEDFEQEKFYIETLRSRLVDGFIFSTARAGAQNIMELETEGFPVVLLLRQLEDCVNAVVLDNFNSAYQAVKYLISRGLRSIGLINGPLELTLYEERFAGYKKAMAEAGLALPEQAIVHGIEGGEDAYLATKDILKTGVKVDAFFATNDPKALGAMRAVKDYGLAVPNDISIMGFDNLDFAPLLDPPLTTVAQPFYEMGAKACQRLISIIEEKKNEKPQIDILAAKVIVRGSVI
ncbi:LacI family DNA-binding transcriptional regulator [Anaerospora hongkongensis]|uniref:LacI family DNA-binding transcriptional regulator n=1 Tax=Anaerospora hongkongensis TaxID=244830 RepID=UPI00289E2379|nr:LacI family DNA-binding transcriptional regulator [Anaerospora hongkongensis]